MAYQTILCDKEEGIGIITLNRPQRMNAISLQLVNEFITAIEEMGRDSGVRVVILSGGDKVFCVGADLKEERPPHFLPKIRELFHKIEYCDKVVIAAISGYALGGGLEMALACDLRLASDTARLGVPEIKIGAIPGGGGTQRLPRLIGAARAKEFIFFGEPVDAAEAYRLGLVNKVVPSGSLMEEARRIARILGQGPPLALKMAKFCVNTGLKVDLESGLDYEANCAGLLNTTEDRQEGNRAFLEKRKPIFKGK